MKSSREVIERRHEQIMSYLQTSDTCSVTQLANSMHVSPVTLRRDLEILESKSLIERFFGGARIHSSGGYAESPVESADDKAQRCNRIAREAATFIDDGDTIFINSSATALRVYSFIERESVVVITNNGRSLLAPRNKDVELVLTGGEVHGNKHSLVGEFALAAISKVKCNKCIIGVAGISVAGGITSSILPETAINRAMISNSTGHKIVVADGSKIGVVQDFHSSPLENITHLITDNSADPEEILRIRKAGIEVVLV